MPLITINTKKINENFCKMNNLCQSQNKDLMVITKGIRTNKIIINELIKNGAKAIGDTNKINLGNIDLNIKKMLMKVTLDLKDLEPKDFDIFYLSDLNILKNIAEKNGSKETKVIIPIELGELREGIPNNEILQFVKEALKIKNVNLLGISANFGCLAGLIPNLDKYNMLISIHEKIRREINYEFQIKSIGGTIVYDSLQLGEVPKEINHIRMGEAIFTGQNTSMNSTISGLNRDTFILSGEIIELSYKDTDICGEYGFNAFGNSLNTMSSLLKRGKRKRAILNFGFLAELSHKLQALDKNICVVGNSYDFTVIDLEDSEKDYKVGDKIEFYIDYSILYYSMLLPEINKVIL